MSAKVKSVFKVLGYIVFFMMALCAFIYLTLPLDALRDYMVRKASDEYGADLEITEMSMWGISGLEMEGVTLTPRPTPEELAEMQKARAARAAWQASRKAKAENETAEGAAGEGAAPADPAAKPGAPEKPGAPVAVGSAPPEKPGAGAKGADAKDKGKLATAKSDKKAKADTPPPIPPGPQPLFVESLRARVALGMLISDLADGKVFNEDGAGELQAALLGGSIDAEMNRTAEQMAVKAQFQGLDLRQLTVLRSFLPVPIVGDFEGEVDVEVPVDEGGAFRLASTAGHLRISISNAVLGPGRIESDSLRNFGGFFDVPRLRMEAFGGKINFERRRATFDDFAFRGKDLEGDVTGYVQLANKVERFNPRAYLRFKFDDDFLEREKGIGVLMRTVPEIKRGTGGDGFTGFAVSMKTDRKTRKKKLSWRPTPRNPYERAGATRRGDKDTAGDKKGTTRTRKPSTVRKGRDPLRDRKTRRATSKRPKPRFDKRKGPPETAAEIPPAEPPESAAEPEDEPEDEEEIVEEEGEGGAEEGAGDAEDDGEGGADEEE